MKCYVLKLCFSESINITPEEIWSDYKSDVTHLGVFVCVAYAHIQTG